MSPAIIAAIGEIAAKIVPAVLGHRREGKDERYDNLLTWRLFFLMREAEQLPMPGHDRMFWVLEKFFKKHKRLAKRARVSEVAEVAQRIYDAMEELEDLGEDAFGLAPGAPGGRS